MKDLLTMLTMKIGQNMSSKEENTLYEAKNDEDTWKIDAIVQYATYKLTSRNTAERCTIMAKDFGLDSQYTTVKFWNDKIKEIKAGLKKDKKEPEVKKAAKVVQSASYDYGCGGGSSDYGCGSSSRRSYRSSSYGCGGSSSSYGC